MQIAYTHFYLDPVFKEFHYFCCILHCTAINTTSIVRLWIEIKAGLFTLLIRNTVLIFLSDLIDNGINVWNNDIPQRMKVLAGGTFSVFSP